MRAGAASLWCVVAIAALPASARAQAERALLAQPQGSEELRATVGQQAVAAVAAALEERGVVAKIDPRLGDTLVACEDPTCTEETLGRAKADMGFVLAVWKRRDTGETELTLTFLDKNARSLNARESLSGLSIAQAAEKLVGTLLERREQENTALAPLPEAPSKKKRGNGWLAGPIVLLAAGAGLIAGGAVAVANQSCVQRDVSGCIEKRQVNELPVAAMWLVGVTAISGGIAWWVVGKRERSKDKGIEREQSQHKGVSVGIGPTRLDVRLDF